MTELVRERSRVSQMYSLRRWRLVDGRALALLLAAALGACASEGPTERATSASETPGEVTGAYALDALHEPVDPGSGGGVYANNDAAEATQRFASYFALGDSFAAGTGNQDARNRVCGDSAQAWPVQLATALELNDGVHFSSVACSGAVTANILGSNSVTIPALPPQIDRINGAGDGALITVMIGGNDVGVSTQMVKCVFGDCSMDGAAFADSIRTILVPNLSRTFAALRSAAPDATIVAVGYPYLVPEGGCAGNGITDLEAATIHTAVDELNAAIAHAAKCAGLAFVTDKIVRAFAGHEACTAEPFINTANLLNVMSSYHPNEAGNQAYSKTLALALSTLPSAGVDLAECGAQQGTPVSQTPQQASTSPFAATPSPSTPTAVSRQNVPGSEASGQQAMPAEVPSETPGASEDTNHAESDAWQSEATNTSAEVNAAGSADDYDYGSDNAADYDSDSAQEADTAESQAADEPWDMAADQAQTQVDLEEPSPESDTTDFGDAPEDDESESDPWADD